MQCFVIYIVNLGTIANLQPISTKAKTMNTYEAITYSLYTNTKDISYKNGIHDLSLASACDMSLKAH